MVGVCSLFQTIRNVQPSGFKAEKMEPKQEKAQGATCTEFSVRIPLGCELQLVWIMLKVAFHTGGGCVCGVCSLSTEIWSDSSRGNAESSLLQQAGTKWHNKEQAMNTCANVGREALQ